MSRCFGPFFQKICLKNFPESLFGHQVTGPKAFRGPAGITPEPPGDREEGTGTQLTASYCIINIQKHICFI